MDNVVVVNEKDEVIGTMLRQDAHKNGTAHRTAVIFVENGMGDILVQIRASLRHDHSSAGHVDPGESYAVAAERELEEELGISGVELHYIGKGWSEETVADIGEHRVHVFHMFLCTAEPGKLDSKEVSGVYWAKPEAILKEMEKDTERKYTRGFKESLKIYMDYRS